MLGEIVHEYTGPTDDHSFDRDILGINMTFSKVVRLEELLWLLAIETEQSGDDFVLFDAGNGKAGFFDCLQNTDQAQRFLDVLKRQHRRVDGYGFTDAPSVDLQNTLINTTRFHPYTGVKGGLKNYFFTLAHRPTQSLRYFFESNAIPQCNFMLACQFLMYLSSTVFEETIEAMIQHLKPGGTLVASGVGTLDGPIPAFRNVTTNFLKEASSSSDARVINFFNPVNDSPVNIAKLVESPDWQEVSLEGEKLVHRIQSAAKKEKLLAHRLDHFFQGRADDITFGLKSSVDHGEEVQKAVRIHVILRIYLGFIRERQQLAQVGRKQRFLENLKRDTRIELTPLKHQEPQHHISNFLIKRVS